jgi:hypothetical protein
MFVYAYIVGVPTGAHRKSDYGMCKTTKSSHLYCSSLSISIYCPPPIIATISILSINLYLLPATNNRSKVLNHLGHSGIQSSQRGRQLHCYQGYVTIRYLSNSSTCLWTVVDSMDIHGFHVYPYGFHGYQWIPWISMNSMDIHGINGYPSIPWFEQHQMCSDNITEYDRPHTRR